MNASKGRKIRISSLCAALLRNHHWRSCKTCLSHDGAFKSPSQQRLQTTVPHERHSEMYFYIELQNRSLVICAMQDALPLQESLPHVCAFFFGSCTGHAPVSLYRKLPFSSSV